MEAPKTIPHVNDLRDLFYEQVHKCKCIEHEITLYKMMDDDNPEKTYEYLRSAVDRHLSVERMEKMQKANLQHIVDTAKMDP